MIDFDVFEAGGALVGALRGAHSFLGVVSVEGLVSTWFTESIAVVKFVSSYFARSAEGA